MKNKVLFAVLLSAFATTAHGQSCDPSDVNSNVVVDPPEFQWSSGHHHKSGTLVMDKATLDINGESLTTRVYAQEGGSYSIPGPTLVMSPGQLYVMQFKNLLDFEPLSPEHNVFKDPNVTNVHTHGLHISGETPGDDVTRAFAGRQGGDYAYDIPSNHMGGTFWYHAHHHGSTFLQVSSGAFGLIIVDDANDGMPPNVAAMEERHLLLGYLEPGNAAGTGGDSLISGTFSNGWTLNGTVNGDVCVPQNTWQHWRMLVADQDARLVDLEIGDGCEVEMMARDGVWRTQVPKALPDGTLTLTGASRADLAVRCSADSTITVGGVQVANVRVDASLPTNDAVHPYAENGTVDGGPQWSAVRPDYLRDLRDTAPIPVIPSDSETIRMGARSVLGSKFDKYEPNLVKDANGVQEWSLNGAANHPFHLHIYHVQVQSDCGPYEAGEFYDVIAGNCDLRFDMSAAEAYEGRTIFHCHILQHEDQGAMGWMQVNGGRPAPVLPEGYSPIYDLGGGDPTGPVAPSGFSATAISSSEVDLSWTDESNDEDWFAIERRTDSTNFSEIGTVAPGVETYSDTGLSASTTYYYKVAAVNNDGTSYSGEDNATTFDTGGTPTSVEVASITVSTIGLGKGLKRGQATIVVSDNLGGPVSYARVDGYFTGDLSGTAIKADTLEDDTVSVLTDDTAKKVRALEFCVTYIEHASLADYDSQGSVPVCASL
jgi:FtsP/CotA-like multicopper oxidase with cupredoxin domain